MYRNEVKTVRLVKAVISMNAVNTVKPVRLVNVLCGVKAMRDVKAVVLVKRVHRSRGTDIVAQEH